MSDLISRQAAIDAMKELCEHYTPTKSVTHPHVDFVIEQLMCLPSAQPERKKGEWIPCSERLPELHSEPYYMDFDGILYESDFVLVCYKSGKEKGIGIGQIIHDKECGSYEWNGVYDYAECEVDDMRIIAWMPLPSPYQEERRTDENC